MAQITAAAVKELRERTGLPMMDCKKALEAVNGDGDAAVDWLRKSGKKTMEKRAGRQTSAGRVTVFTDMAAGVGAMVELQCESAPVANNEEFISLANDLVAQLGQGPGAKTPEELLSQPSPSKAGKTLQEQLDDLTNRIREVFRVQRIVRIDSACGGYAHHNGTVGVLLQVSGKTDATLAKDICMHVAAMRPTVVGVKDLDQAAVAKEREILSAAARTEGKPEAIIGKMVDGRMKNYYAEQCLLEQPFVKDDSQTVGNVAKAAGMEIVRFVHWELGKE
jgi:elongation factor Ts